MGAVIGLFSPLSSQLTLPPLALAFLAGYGWRLFFPSLTVLSKSSVNPRRQRAWGLSAQSSQRLMLETSQVD